MPGKALLVLAVYTLVQQLARAVGQALGGGRTHAGNANHHESLITAISIDASTKITIRTCT